MNKNKIVIIVLIIFLSSLGATVYFYSTKLNPPAIVLPPLPTPTLGPTNTPQPTPTLEPHVQTRIEIEKEIISIKNDLEKIKTLDSDLYPPNLLFDIPK